MAGALQAVLPQFRSGSTDDPAASFVGSVLRSPQTAAALAQRFFSSPAIAGPVADAHAAAAAGNYPEMVGDYLRADVGVPYTALKNTVGAAVTPVIRGAVDFGRGLAGAGQSSPATPAASATKTASAPGQSATETAAPAEPAEPPVVTKFKQFAALTKGMSNNQFDAFIKNYPRTPIIDPKTLASNQYLQAATLAHQQRIEALGQSGLKGDAFDQKYREEQSNYLRDLLPLFQPNLAFPYAPPGLTQQQ